VDSNNVKGWDDFKKEIYKDCSNVDNISFYSLTPTKMTIEFILNAKLKPDIMEVIFNKTKNFILTEESFNDFKRIHWDKHKSSFAQIEINFNIKNNETQCKFIGVTKKNKFDTWHVKFSKQNSKIYEPGNITSE
jgi:hypothetical protein